LREVEHCAPKEQAAVEAIDALISGAFVRRGRNGLSSPAISDIAALI
jgi:hypothetical protein